MSENKETLDLSSSPTEDKSEVKGPSVKIQHMDGILKNIIEQMQMQKKNVSEEEQDEDYEKLVDQIDNELSEVESDGESEDDEEEMEEEMDEDVRWTALQKLLDSHQLLCESFNKLLHEEDEE
jgi:hypothetical protein